MARSFSPVLFLEEEQDDDDLHTIHDVRDRAEGDIERSEDRWLGKHSDWTLKVQIHTDDPFSRAIHFVEFKVSFRLGLCLILLGFPQNLPQNKHSSAQSAGLIFQESTTVRVFHTFIYLRTIA